jgi:hypothetical protein
VAELLHLQYEDYAHALGPAYHALKTSDHVSRYRRDIVTRLHAWQLDGDWLDRAADELATQSRLSPAQAASEINHYMRFVVNQLESLDPLLGEIDRRHAQYLRTSLRQIRYQLVGADGGFKDRLALLARGLADLQIAGEDVLPEDMPAFQSSPVRQPDSNSLYTPPRRRAPFAPGPVVTSVLDPADVRALRAVTLEQEAARLGAKLRHSVSSWRPRVRRLYRCGITATQSTSMAIRPRPACTVVRAG